MCGIVGAFLANPTGSVGQMLYDALILLQHRGQDAAGIVTVNNKRLHLRKANGLVRDVFEQQHMQELVGNTGIGHCRYPTAGSSTTAEAQPFYTNAPYGICLAHNGNLTNAQELLEELTADCRHINTSSDSEVLLNIFADALLSRGKKIDEVTPDDVFYGVEKLQVKCRGGFAAVVMINGVGLLAFRDCNGIRPCTIGTRTDDKHGIDYMIASESVAIDALGFTVQRDLAPGEAIFIRASDGSMHAKQCAEKAQLSPCIFEHVYLARPDSTMDGISVYQARLKMGELLAGKIARTRPKHEIDVVMPVPDTARTVALQVAYHLGLPYREGFIKNRYIARTFIMPGQEGRKNAVRRKLNPIKSEFRGRNVLLVDDSIVRGTTSAQLVALALEAGARNVFFCSAAPAIRYPNVYGIDMPSQTELVAFDRDEDAIAQKLGCSWVMYQDLEDLEAAVKAINPSIKTFDTSCFSGKYVTGDIDEAYFVELHKRRNDEELAKKNSRVPGAAVVGAAGKDAADIHDGGCYNIR